MALILILETATSYCSVALSENGNLIASIDSNEQNDHTSVLSLFIQDVFMTTGFDLKDIDAVAVSKGPGSYTGLRIGVSAAKGLCYSMDKPLIGLNTLEGMAYGMIHNVVRERSLDSRTLFCPMIDARRMEVYCSVFDYQLHLLKETSAMIIDGNSFSDLLKHNNIVFFGDGAEKTEKFFGNNSFVSIMKNFNPSAAYLCNMAEEQYNLGKFENIVYFEPYYLKQFVAGKPNVKGMN